LLSQHQVLLVHAYISTEYVSLQ